MNGHSGIPPTDQELAALADGTLDPGRRREIENQLASSEQIRDSIGRQRAAIDLARELDVQAPDALHTRVSEMAASAAPRRSRALAFGGVAAAAAAAILLALVLVVPGGGAPTVNQVAAAAASGPTTAAPAQDQANPGSLALAVGSVRFPYWEDSEGWRATGRRSSDVSGRAVETVFYANASGARLKYSVVDGPPIDNLGGAYLITRSRDTRRIVWRNGGHTCIIEATGVTAGELERLAA